MRIKEVEELVGITRKNIRFYESQGLLNPGRESENSYRDYGEPDILRLKQIKLLRKLNMPISEIKAILDGGISLSAAVRRHSISLSQQVRNLQSSREVCDRIALEEVRLAGLAVDRYLYDLDTMEREGSTFPNIAQRDVKHKYFGPVASALAVVLIVLGCTVLFMLLNNMAEIPVFLIIFGYILAGIIALGTVYALVVRIKEIREGEDNDLGNY